MPGKSGERRRRQRRKGEASMGGEERRLDRSSAASKPVMDLDFVRGLIAAVDESSIDSLEINRAGTRIRISKTPPGTATASGQVPTPVAAPIATIPQVAPPAAPAAPAAPAPAEPAPEAKPTPEEETAADNLIEITSPMVGTFYRAPAPEAPPYVEVGSTVTKGQTLCILEAMKLMNELESEVDGVVREILVSNAEPVEYGQVLFRIEPNS